MWHGPNMAVACGIATAEAPDLSIAEAEGFAEMVSNSCGA